MTEETDFCYVHSAQVFANCICAAVGDFLNVPAAQQRQNAMEGILSHHRAWRRVDGDAEIVITLWDI